MTPLLWVFVALTGIAFWLSVLRIMSNNRDKRKKTAAYREEILAAKPGDDIIPAELGFSAGYDKLCRKGSPGLHTLGNVGGTLYAGNIVVEQNEDQSFTYVPCSPRIRGTILISANSSAALND